MGRRDPIGSEVVKDYMRRFPDLPNKALARKIFQDDPVLFRDVEQIRGRIRYYRGQCGSLNRKNKSDNSFDMKPAENAIKMGVPNPYGLPKSEEASFKPFKIPRGNNRILILSDIHFPYHNVEALTAALRYGEEKKVNAVILNGDTLDCYQLSRFSKDPRKRSFASELEDCRNFLEMLKNTFNCPIYFKLGNHEERYEAFLRTKAPELLDVSDYKLDVLLRFGQYGVTLIDKKRIIKAGKLSILHGHEFGQQVFSPVNPARGYYMKAKKSMVAGHNHQTSEHVEPDLDGNSVTCWSTGCLCELTPEYRPINKWNHGFAYAEIQPSGKFHLQNLRVIDGEIY